MRDLLVTAYDEVHARICATVSSCRPDELDAVVPATPAWTVRQLLAHLVGGPVDLTGGGMPEVDGLDARDDWRDPAVRAAVDAMTARQVRERAHLDAPQLLQEWRGVVPAWRDVLRGTRPPARTSTPYAEVITVIDAVVHDDDLHRALGREVPGPSPALSLGLTLHAKALDGRLRTLGLPGVRLVSELGELTAGPEARLTLRAPARTLLRVLTDRIPEGEVRELLWDGDPSPLLPVLGAYRPPAAVPAQAASADAQRQRTS